MSLHTLEESIKALERLRKLRNTFECCYDFVMESNEVFVVFSGSPLTPGFYPVPFVCCEPR